MSGQDYKIAPKKRDPNRLEKPVRVAESHQSLVTTNDRNFIMRLLFKTIGREHLLKVLLLLLVSTSVFGQSPLYEYKDTMPTPYHLDFVDVPTFWDTIPDKTVITEHLKELVKTLHFEDESYDVETSLNMVDYAIDNWVNVTVGLDRDTNEVYQEFIYQRTDQSLTMQLLEAWEKVTFSALDKVFWRYQVFIRFY